MGLLSSVTGAIFGKSNGPSYNMDQGAKMAQYGVESGIGNMTIKKNADGTYSKVYTTSDIDKQRNALASQGLGALSLDPTQTQQAYYDQASSLLNKQFGQQREDLDRQLINRGIQTGTEQYNTAMSNLTDSQNQTLQNLANQAVYMGTQNVGNQIGNVNALTGARDVYGVSALGGSNQAYDNYYNSLQNQYTAQANKNQQLLNMGTSLGAAYLMGSDKRLKENLKKVGALANGLNVYVGNYKKETGLDTRPQLFLLAQEVQKKKPEAVGKVNGYLAVDYLKATKKGK